MNILIGMNMAYLSFVPNAGNSISVALITIILFFILSGISLGVYCKTKMNKENSQPFFQRHKNGYHEIRRGKTQLAV